MLSGVLAGLPPKELRRRARRDNKSASVYKLAAYGNSAKLFLRLLAALAAGGLVVLAFGFAWQTGLAASAAAVWLAWYAARPQTSGWRFQAAARIAPLFAAAAGLFQPVLGRAAKLNKSATGQTALGVFEKEDLLELLKQLVRRRDSRLEESDLKTAYAALSLSDKKVRDAMLTRRRIKWVAADEAISPIIMDELHQTGRGRFPVVKDTAKTASPEIVGCLYISDLLDKLESKGRIRDVMHPGANYINEEQDLRGALDGFIKSGQLQLVAVNNFEEITGLISLEDVLRQIFGESPESGFDRYDDIRSVAAGADSQLADAKVE